MGFGLQSSAMAGMIEISYIIHLGTQTREQPLGGGAEKDQACS